MHFQHYQPFVDYIVDSIHMLVGRKFQFPAEKCMWEYTGFLPSKKLWPSAIIASTKLESTFKCISRRKYTLSPPTPQIIYSHNSHLKDSISGLACKPLPWNSILPHQGTKLEHFTNKNIGGKGVRHVLNSYKIDWIPTVSSFYMNFVPVEPVGTLEDGYLRHAPLPRIPRRKRAGSRNDSRTSTWQHRDQGGGWSRDLGDLSPPPCQAPSAVRHSTNVVINT